MPTDDLNARAEMLLSAGKVADLAPWIEACRVHVKGDKLVIAPVDWIESAVEGAYDAGYARAIADMRAGNWDEL